MFPPVCDRCRVPRRTEFPLPPILAFAVSNEIANFFFFSHLHWPNSPSRKPLPNCSCINVPSSYRFFNRPFSSTDIVARFHPRRFSTVRVSWDSRLIRHETVPRDLWILPCSLVSMRSGYSTSLSLRCTLSSDVELALSRWIERKFRIERGRRSVNGTSRRIRWIEIKSRSSLGNWVKWSMYLRSRDFKTHVSSVKI